MVVSLDIRRKHSITLFADKRDTKIVRRVRRVLCSYDERIVNTTHKHIYYNYSINMFKVKKHFFVLINPKKIRVLNAYYN